MNNSDIFVIVVTIIFVAYGIYRGFFAGLLHTLAALLSGIVSMFGYPFLSALLRNSGTFDIIRNTVIQDLNIAGVVTDGSKQTQNLIISELPLPDAFKEIISTNNNSVIYDLLGVNNIVDYIGAFIANMVINIAAGVLLFLIFFFLSRMIFTAFNIMEKLPVIRTFSRVGGGLTGIVAAIIFVWIVFAVMDLFLTKPFFSAMYDDIMQSKIAIVLYNTDIIRNIVLKRMF